MEAQTDIENKHIEIIKSMEYKSSCRVCLPNNIICQYENGYLVFYRQKLADRCYDFDLNPINFNNICNIEIKSTTPRIEKNKLVFDMDKLPKGVVWRKRRQGDFIFKINGTKQKLKDFLIERKIPIRNREFLPVLAFQNEIYICANIDICDKIKIDKNSKNAFNISIDYNFKE